MTPAERATKWNNEHYSIHRLHNILQQCEKRAARKGIPYTIDFKWFKHKAIDVGVCEDTGIPFDHTKPAEKNKKNPFSASIDRRDPTLGYTPENCKVVVWIHNRAKGDNDIGVLYFYCKALVEAIEGK